VVAAITQKPPARPLKARAPAFPRWPIPLLDTVDPREANGSVQAAGLEPAPTAALWAFRCACL